MSELDLGAKPGEKRCGQFAFQTVNLLRDRRLAQAHASGGLGDAARRSGVTETAQLLKAVLFVTIS